MAKRGKQGDGGGRPKVEFTEEQIEQVQSLSAVLNQSQMADFFGIGEVTFREVMKRQPEVSVAYKNGKAKAIGRVGQGLLQKALDGDTASQIFYLKTQAQWKETSVVEGSLEVKEFGDMYGNPEPES